MGMCKREGRGLLGLLAAMVLAGGCQRPADTAVAPPAAAANPATIRTKSGVEMVPIPAGEFVMGDEKGEDDEKPAHRVQVSAFTMDVSEVTQESFQAMLGRNPAKWAAPTSRWSA